MTQCYFDKPCEPGCTGTVKNSEPFSWSKSNYYRAPRIHITRGETAELIRSVFGKAAADTYKAGNKKE
jgi:hypothetical protein